MNLQNVIPIYLFNYGSLKKKITQSTYNNKKVKYIVKGFKLQISGFKINNNNPFILYAGGINIIM